VQAALLEQPGRRAPSPADLRLGPRCPPYTRCWRQRRRV